MGHVAAWCSRSPKDTGQETATDTGPGRKIRLVLTLDGDEIRGT